MHALREADHGQGLGSPFLTLRAVDFRVQRRQFRVLERRSASQQIEALENESNLLIADQGQGLFVVPRNIGPFEEIAAGTRLVETTEYVHERGFAASARAHDCHKFAAMDPQTDTAQGMHTGFTKFVVFMNLLNANNRGVGRTRFGSVDLVGRRHGMNEVS